MKLKNLNWELPMEDSMAIAAIVVRAASKLDIGHKLELSMDLTACHLNGCKLRLKELLEADDFNFAHDVMGIQKHIDRRTGELKDFFLPRFSVEMAVRP